MCSHSSCASRTAGTTEVMKLPWKLHFLQQISSRNLFGAFRRSEPEMKFLKLGALTFTYNQEARAEVNSGQAATGRFVFILSRAFQNLSYGKKFFKKLSATRADLQR